MPAKRCLILAAGFGTRMGPIGKRLPKVMWPIFGQSLLELQLRFAQRLGYSDVWINLFHQADTILQMTAGNPVFKDVHWLRETPEILDIGGGIHNLASRPEVNYQGELLVLNADQFLWFTKSDLEHWRLAAQQSEVMLLNWEVDSTLGYNQVLSDPHRQFLKVVKNAELPRGLKMETYSGNALINLERLNPQSGPSNFFDSVCNPTLHRCATSLIRDGHYWDFGTAPRYWKSIQGIIHAKASQNEDPFTRFIEETGAFNRSFFRPATLSYASDVSNLMNFGEGIPADTHPAGCDFAWPSAARRARRSLSRLRRGSSVFIVMELDFFDAVYRADLEAEAAQCAAPFLDKVLFRVGDDCPFWANQPTIVAGNAYGCYFEPNHSSSIRPLWII